MNQTQIIDSTTSASSEMMSWTNSTPDTTPDLDLNVGFTVQANESHEENVTDEMIWSLDCGTFVTDYGIIACVICSIAFVIGVIFCMFGE